MTLVWLALVSLVQVFAMAFQSKNINGGHYALAALGSIFIGLSQAFVWKAITASGAHLTETLVYAVSGGAGCVFAMWTHRRFVKEKARG
jgi:hypothetical protein